MLVWLGVGTPSSAPDSGFATSGHLKQRTLRTNAVARTSC